LSADLRLVLLARGGDQHAFGELLERYEGIVIAIASEYFLPRADHEDLVQEARLGFFKAVRDYRPGHASFATFARLCVQRQVITAVKTATRRKHEALNEAIGERRDEGEEELSVATLCADPNADPADVFERYEVLGRVVVAFHESLSGLEARAVQGVVAGESYDEIGAECGLGYKSIDNALQRARRKLEVAA
jgi:RNA polymerase sporulation-specific sigma factor